MKIITRFLTLLLLTMAFLSYGQQTQTVRGIIIDEASKAPITGASILLIQSGAKKPIATSTNTEGEFMLNALPISRQTLRITYIGYEQIRITISSLLRAKK